MLATGTVALYVYLAVAFSQLRMRKKIEAEGKAIDFKMWLFPWLTYLVIFIIIGAIVTMLIEGTYFKEVIYTTGLALVIVALGVLTHKFNWGKEARQHMLQENKTQSAKSSGSKRTSSRGSFCLSILLACRYERVGILASRKHCSNTPKAMTMSFHSHRQSPSVGHVRHGHAHAYNIATMPEP